MLIENGNNKLCEIKIGECFKAYDSFYIRTDGQNEGLIRCVNLKNGVEFYYSKNEVVEAVCAKVVIQ